MEDQKKTYRNDILGVAAMSTRVFSKAAVTHNIDQCTTPQEVMEYLTGADRAMFDDKNYFKLKNKTKPGKNYRIQDINRHQIRNVINDLYINHSKLPVTRQIFEKIISKSNNKTDSELRNILRQFGYTWRKLDDKHKILIEYPEMARQRFNYLKRIQNYRKNNHTLVYLEPYCTSDDSVNYEVPLLITPGVECIAQANNPYLQKILGQTLKAPCVLVIDENYVEKTEKTLQKPKITSSRSEMLAYLKYHGIPHSKNMHTCEYYDLIQKFPKEKTATYVIENEYKIMGIDVLVRPKWMRDFSLMFHVLEKFGSMKFNSRHDVSNIPNEIWLTSLHDLSEYETKAQHDDERMEDIIDGIVDMVKEIGVPHEDDFETNITSDEEVEIFFD